jgi:hypothetical protein
VDGTTGPEGRATVAKATHPIDCAMLNLLQLHENFFFFFDTEAFYITQAGLKLKIPCLSLGSPGFLAMCHQVLVARENFCTNSYKTYTEVLGRESRCMRC